jgi:hypothetical protein
VSWRPSWEAPRAVYGAPPAPGRGRLDDEQWERVGREVRLRMFGIALWDLIAPLCGEEPIA